MKKGYYIICKGNTEFVGVNKKIRDQIRAFNLYCDCQMLPIYREKYKLIKSIVWRLPFGSFGFQYDQAWEQIDNPDFVYIRFRLVDRKFLRFIKELRTRFPKCKIVMEVPTYPYIHEWRSAPSMLPFFFKDFWNNRKLKKYVDRIVTFWEYDQIFGIPVIFTINGVDIQRIKTVQPVKHNKDEIHIIGVAMLQIHHGYERLIEGMKQFYSDKNANNSRKIYFHIVGDGPEKKKYEEQVRKYSLEDKVFFYGMKKGEALDDIYNKCDLAVASLGMYKYKLNSLAALKVGEYLAKGLPIICGCQVNIPDFDYSFCLEFPNDSSSINIENVIHFFDKIYVNSHCKREEIINNIREYAENKVSMDIAVEPIIRYIEKT